MNIREEYKKSLKMLEVEEVLDLVLYRPLALAFVRLVYRTPLTPNGITLMSLLSGLISAYCFAQGTVSGMAWGGIWYAIANTLDCSDGQLARLQNSGTPFGRLVDGVVDWVISVAIFAGLGIGLQRSTGDSTVWWIVSAAGFTSALHAFFFDLYQQQFISTVRGQKNFVERELEKTRTGIEELNRTGQNPFRRMFLAIYLRYLEAQRTSRSSEGEEHEYPPDLYRGFNRNVMRFWTLLGPTTNRSLLMVAGLLNNASIFLWPVITLGNIILIVAIIWQRRVLRQLDKMLKHQSYSRPSPKAKQYRPPGLSRDNHMNQIILDRNENQYGPAPACYDALQTANLEQLSLYSREFARGRKSELSDLLARSIGIPEERLLLSYGSEEMLKQVVHCYLHKDEILLLPKQSWWYYKKVASEVFGKEVEYSLVERKGRFEYDVQQICELYDRHHPQLVLIASPNNPTGSSISKQDLATVVNHCGASVIVLDEAYYGFTSESNDDLKELLDTHQRLVIMRTFSKYFALAGLRIGYACIGKDLKQLAMFSARYLGFNQLSEKIALAALNAPEYYRTITRKMQQDKEMYYMRFGAFDGFHAFPSDANFVLVRYPVPMKQILDEGLKKRGIIVKFLSDPGLEDCMRITLGTEEQNACVMTAFDEIVGVSNNVPPKRTRAAVAKG